MIHDILKQYGFYTKKSLGQNFLDDQSILETIAAAGDIQPTDTIIEIGPGLGTLTELLCQQAKQVIAIEKDSTLIPIIEDRLKQYDNLKIIEADALQFNPTELESYKIIANIPYYITSPLINHFLKDIYTKPKTLDPSFLAPSLLVLLTQKEVAEKICAANNKMSVLALNVQTFATAEIIENVPATAFVPPPKVESAIIKITPYKKPIIATDLLDTYYQLIHAGFHQKRKKIAKSISNNLLSAPGPKPIPQISHEKIKELLIKANIDPNRRAETLKIDEWTMLANTLKLEKILTNQ